MAVSVPKRIFKRAVDRNLLKRRIREAYRLNKSQLTTLPQQQELRLKLVIQYQHKEIKSFQIIERALINGLLKLNEKLKVQNCN